MLYLIYTNIHYFCAVSKKATKSIKKFAFANSLIYSDLSAINF